MGIKSILNLACWISIVFIMVSTICYGDELFLTWDPNTEPNLAGYRMFVRQEGEPYDYDFPVWQGSENICKIDELDPNDSYYFVLRAYDFDDFETGNSNEVYLPPRTGNSGGGGGGCLIRSLAYH